MMTGYKSRLSRHSTRLLSRQGGMTTLGMMIVACCVGLIAFAALRLTPVYLNNMKVSGVLNGVHDEFDGQSPSRIEIRTSMERRFDIESVTEIEVRDITITTDEAGFVITATYDHKTPFISNISFSLHFDKSVQVRR
jgi:hypothetical protein